MRTELCIKDIVEGGNKMLILKIITTVSTAYYETNTHSTSSYRPLQKNARYRLSNSIFHLLFQLWSLRKKKYSCHRDSVSQKPHLCQLCRGWETLNSAGKGK